MAALRRDLSAFTPHFDVLVVGAGIYGSEIASRCARHGLRVALIDRADFGAATSHNSLKLVHGGLRYLQHLDLARVRESVRAQHEWLMRAPQIVRPLRFVIPTYGWGTRGPLALAAAVAAYQVLAFDRNRGLVDAARMPAGSLLSRRRLFAQYPMLQREGVTGGASWYDAQFLDPNRLTLQSVRDAAVHGAIVANHVEASSLTLRDGAVTGVLARDRIEGTDFEIRARLTINAAGPWAQALLERSLPSTNAPAQRSWSRNMNIVTRQIAGDSAAVGVSSDRASDASIGKSRRLFFVTPWRDCSIIGTSHEPFHGDPASAAPTEAQVHAFVAKLAAAMPEVQLRPQDVRYVHSGLIPSEAEGPAHRPALYDHRSQGVPGLITALGIKYTTAPVVAQAVVRMVASALGRSLSAASTLPHPDASPPTANCVTEADMFRSRVVHGIRAEMAVRLSDGIFRCTDLAERGRLSSEDLHWAADAFQRELGWTPQRREQELTSAAGALAARHGRLIDGSEPRG